MPQRILNTTSQAVQGGQTIGNVVSLRILFAEFVQMFPGAHVVADIHQRNGVVVVLLGCFKLSYGGLSVLVTGVEMSSGAVCQFRTGAGYNLLKMALGFVELVFLHGAQSRLVILHSLCKTGIVARSEEHTSELQSRR